MIVFNECVGDGECLCYGGGCWLFMVYDCV